MEVLRFQIPLFARGLKKITYAAGLIVVTEIAYRMYKRVKGEKQDEETCIELDITKRAVPEVLFFRQENYTCYQHVSDETMCDNPCCPVRQVM